MGNFCGGHHIFWRFVGETTFLFLLVCFFSSGGFNYFKTHRCWQKTHVFTLDGQPPPTYQKNGMGGATLQINI